MERGGGVGGRSYGNMRPKGLRGREIGLYYRNLAQKRKQEGERIHLGPSVSMPGGVLAQVNEYLQKFTENSGNDRVSYEFEENFRQILEFGFNDFIRQARALNIDMKDDEFLNQRFKGELIAKEATAEYRELYDQRRKLPTVKMHKNILEAIKDNQVVLIVGSTGCGKTTQVPQLLLDDYIYSEHGSKCRIVCTQPRRISAVSVAERVAYERCENLGKSVGYQIRLESQMPRDHGCILYCTTGIVLQQMQSDPLLSGLSAIILDEIHERSVETDLLMALLKQILPLRPELKVILMSATVSEQDFCDYFNNCYTLKIEGMLFPVKMLFLEDILQETGFKRFGSSVPLKNGRHTKMQRRDAERSMKYNSVIEPYLRQIRGSFDDHVIQSLRCMDSEGCENMQFLEFLIFYICEHKSPGAILVFLPGYDKIAKLHSALQKPTLPNGQRFSQKIVIYPLHSMMPTIHQKSVFVAPPPGMRKIILSTTIAETSVTIDDVVYVINTGRMKMSSYDVESNIQTLEETWVTKANTTQRKGRAGRVQPGICYNLFTRARQDIMDDKMTPEILCCKLESIILNLKLLHITEVFTFLGTLIDAPDSRTIENGINLLKRINALDDNGILTPLGVHLARLPIDPQMAKMIIMGALFRCLDPITSVAAGLSYKSPFYTPLGLEKKVDDVKRELSNNVKSDHLLIDIVLQYYREALEDKTERNFCYKHFLSISTLQQLENMKKQFSTLLRTASFVESPNCRDPTCNENSRNVPLLRAIVAAGLYPNMAFLRKCRQTKNRVRAIHFMSTPEERRVNFHPSSVNSGASSFDSNYFVYFQKQKSTAVYLLDSTMVYPMALIIFGDGVQTGYTPDRSFYISVAHSYYFKCDEDTAKVILDLRHRLEWLMQKKALYPSPILATSGEEYLVRAIQVLLSLDDVYEFQDYVDSSDEESV